MNEQERALALKVQDIINIIIDNQYEYAIDRDRMNKLNEYFGENKDTFSDSFIMGYINFIDNLNSFFDFLLLKLEECEKESLEIDDITSDVMFTFTLNEFKDKEVLLPYEDLIDELNNMLPGNRLLQGIVLYMHLNSLLNKYNFTNNKIKINSNVPIIEIDFNSRIVNYKEDYITVFRHELEEGIRNSVFVDDEEIKRYIISEIKELKNEIQY